MRLSPSERAAAVWLGCTDSMPARYTSATYAEYTSVSATMAQKQSEFGHPLSSSAGIPYPRRKMTRIVGTPRNRSV